MIRPLLKTMRPKQWIKNVIIFVPLVFDQKLTDFSLALVTFLGFLIFCLLSSSVYIINDLSDIEADQQHPKKKNRPLASGALSVRAARIAAVVFILISFVGGILLSLEFTVIAGTYLLLNIAYTTRLKHIPILDVLVLSFFYVLRVWAGVVLVDVERFSPWLYVVTLFGALLIGIGKRRAEMILLKENANSHRRVLDGYTLAFLDQMMIIVASITIMTYSLYTFFAPNLPENDSMMLTIPIVLFGLFRYLYLIMVEESVGAPEEILFSDRQIQLTIILWGLVVIAIFYFFLV